MARKDPPLLAWSALTGTVYIVNRYSRQPGGQIVAHEKFDVTERFGEIETERVEWERQRTDQGDST